MDGCAIDTIAPWEGGIFFTKHDTKKSLARSQT